MKQEEQLVWLRVVVFGFVAILITLLTALVLMFTISIFAEFPFSITNLLGVWAGVFFLGLLLFFVRKGDDT